MSTCHDHPLPLRSPAQARQWLRENGISITRFAHDHRLHYTTLLDVLHGRNRGQFGHGHAAAVALGIKPPPTSPIPAPAPASGA